MKKLIICTAALFYCFFTHAQLAPVKQQNLGQGQYNLLKYWNLRDRLDWWVQKGAANTFGNCPDINTYFGYGLAPSHLYFDRKANNQFNLTAVARKRTAAQKGVSYE